MSHARIGRLSSWCCGNCAKRRADGSPARLRPGGIRIARHGPLLAAFSMSASPGRRATRAGRSSPASERSVSDTLPSGRDSSLPVPVPVAVTCDSPRTRARNIRTSRIAARYGHPPRRARVNRLVQTVASLHTAPSGSNSTSVFCAARMPKPHTASGPSSSGSRPKACSISTSLIAAVMNAARPSSVEDR